MGGGGGGGVRWVAKAYMHGCIIFMPSAKSKYTRVGGCNHLIRLPDLVQLFCALLVRGNFGGLGPRPGKLRHAFAGFELFFLLFLLVFFAIVTFFLFCLQLSSP